MMNDSVAVTQWAHSDATEQGLEHGLQCIEAYPVLNRPIFPFLCNLTRSRARLWNVLLIPCILNTFIIKFNRRLIFSSPRCHMMSYYCQLWFLRGYAVKADDIRATYAASWTRELLSRIQWLLHVKNVIPFFESLLSWYEDEKPCGSHIGEETSLRSSSRLVWESTCHRWRKAWSAWT